MNEHGRAREVAALATIFPGRTNKNSAKEKSIMKISLCIAMAASSLSAMPTLAAILATEQNAIVTAHNTERASTGPSPGVAPLAWSTDLATYAQAWAQSLATQDAGLMHRDNSPNSADFTINNPFKPNEYLGENIYASTAPDDWTMGGAAVADWLTEKQFYNYDSDDGNGAAGSPPGCTAPQGNACGHYTQVVWRATTLVGCGKATSASGWTFVVCNYYSAGNFIGSKPY